MSDVGFCRMNLPEGLRYQVRAIAACGGSLLACDYIIIYDDGNCSVRLGDERVWCVTVS